MEAALARDAERATGLLAEHYNRSLEVMLTAGFTIGASDD